MLLPPELWREILLKSVVETALQSDDEDSLNRSIVTHVLVCKSWSCLVRDPWFRQKALQRFYARGRRVISTV